MSIVQPANMCSLKDIENSLEKLDAAAWVWDTERKRIIWANFDAVKFWQELSVLDLLDTIFDASHPINIQFNKAHSLGINSIRPIDQMVDFTSLDINEITNCQFTQIMTDDNRNALLVKVVEASPEVELGALVVAADPIENHLSKILDNAPVALALFETNGKFNYANKSCKEIFALNADEFEEPDLLSDWFADDEHGENVQNLIDKSLKYKIANLSTKIKTAFGERSHSVIAKSFAIDPSDDAETYILIYLRDVAGERHYERVLVERIAKLENLTELSSDFFFILDDAQTFVQFGGNFSKLTGYKSNELLGETWHNVAERFNLDPDGVAAEYFESQKSFDNLAIDWPVNNSAEKLSLILRGRSIYDEQDDPKLFAGSFVTAIEDIRPLNDTDISSDEQVHSFSEHVELIEEGSDDDWSDATIDQVETETPTDTSQTSELELATLETNLTDNEAVNFASLAQTLNQNATDKDDLETLDGTTDTIKTEPPIELTEQTSEDTAEETVEETSDEPAEETFDDLAEQALDEIVEQVADEVIDEDAPVLADNIVPAFGATPTDVAKFGRTEVNMFKLILNQTPVMAVITSLPSEHGLNTIFANKETLYTLGLIQNKDEELSVQAYSDIMSIESIEFINEHKDDYGDEPIDHEISFLVEGDKYYFNAKVNVIEWQDNKALQYFLSPKRDLDHAVEAEDIKQNVDDISPLVENVSDNVVQFNLDGQIFIDDDQRVLSSNNHLRKLINIAEDDLLDTFITDIIAPSHVTAFQDYLFSVMQDEHKNLELDGLEIELLGDGEETHNVFLHIKRLNDDEAINFPSNILLNMRDISRWKKKEKSLREAKDRAEQENIQKSGFLARISHELRTPLNAIIGFSEVMSDEKFGPLENSRYKGYASDINESSEHLLSLINDLLDLSKIEAGKVELNFKALDLEPLIMQSVSLMQAMADKKRIIIRTSISSTLPQIVADMRSIRQIILNLLSNSIKYSNPGSQIILSALLDDEGEVIIRVRDTGVGMSDVQLKTAMEPFKTLDMSALVDRQGTGLGLPLTKALTEANRADFNIESAVDSGTLVQITFPTTRVLNS
ncbi:MAG: PAS domain S-box protein [Rhizobiales bacterium]|nr:PAS domain S-box protein [Hyphomicrobiales bacterium]